MFLHSTDFEVAVGTFTRYLKRQFVSLLPDGRRKLPHIGIVGAPMEFVVDSVLASFCMSSIREMLLRPPPPVQMDMLSFFHLL